MEKEAKKKGLFATIKESMNKTGGCNCGPGDSCYVAPETDQKAPDALNETDSKKQPEK